MPALLFALTLFCSAALLFVVQPLVGRMLLPALGGSPAVWNTCMVFFQAALLGGYCYAHLAGRWLSPPRQVLAHGLLLLLPLAFLPLRFASGRVDVSEPFASLMLVLLSAVGVPFFVASATAPLLQRWYSLSGARGSADPYFLYAASNAGSLLALVGYPLWLEPRTSLSEQADAWARGYWLLAGLVTLCGVAMLAIRRGGPAGADAPAPLPPQLARGRAWQWLILGAIPSSHLLAVTQYLTTDLAPIPLLWTVPLALYLLSFILGFSPRIGLPRVVLGRVLAVLLVGQAFAMLTHATEPLSVLLPLHLATFFLAAWLCHGWVAELRPPAAELTRFFLLLSLGGVLGGLFNTLLAPLLFHRLGNAEYPLLLVLVAGLRPGQGGGWRLPRRDLLALGLVAALLGLGGLLAGGVPAVRAGLESLASATGLGVEQLASALRFGPALLAVYCLLDRPLRFALGFAMLFLAGALAPGPWGELLHRERNALGVLRVTRDPGGQFHRMIHGNTIHGVQRVGSPEPLSFYHRSGPVGKVLRNLALPAGASVGVVGLGTGSVASYAAPGQAWDFFELDPAVERLARDERYFTFLRDCPARWRVHCGDARVQLQRFAESHFDLLMLDAFSSDAIPIHLLTREALELYRSRLKPGGVILMHISNRTLDLAPVLDRVARDLRPRLHLEVLDDKGLDEADRRAGKSPSVWCVIAADPAALGRALGRRALDERPLDPRIPLWQDDRVDLWPVWRWALHDE